VEPAAVILSDRVMTVRPRRSGSRGSGVGPPRCAVSRSSCRWRRAANGFRGHPGTGDCGGCGFDCVANGWFRSDAAPVVGGLQRV